MKFQIIESCLVNGQHLEEGTVAELTNAEAAALYQAGRGYPVADTPAAEPEPEKPAKAKK